MHFNTAAVATAAAALLAGTASADFLLTLNSCFSNPCVTRGWFITASGEAYWTDAPQGGCRAGPFPGMDELCVDWGHGRAHFIWNGQPKRCLKLVQSYANPGSCDGGRWAEAPCTW